PGSELTEVHAKKLVARVAERFAGPRVHVSDRARLRVMHEDRILRSVEDGAVARFGDTERLGGSGALGDVLAQSVLRVRDLDCHDIESLAETPQLVASLQAAERRQIARREALGR